MWRLFVLFTTIFRLAGAIFCLVGAFCIVTEADNVKYARAISSGGGGYAWGGLGWVLFEFGAYFITFDGIVSLGYSTITRKGLADAWPFYPSPSHPLRNSIRDGALAFGFLLIGLGAGSTSFAYPNEAPREYMDAWVIFYTTRHDDKYLRNGAYLLLGGSALLVVSVVVIAIYCERLDVFYILPCSRCNHERRYAHGVEGAVCCLQLGRPQPVACAVRTRCTAIYQNNCLGAFFNHAYPSYLLYFASAAFWIASLDTTIYSPFSDTCAIPHHNIYDHGLAHTCDHQEEDVGYYMLISSVLFTTAAALFTIHALVYYLSIIVNRPLLVNNFADVADTAVNNDVVQSRKRWDRPG